MYRCCIFDLDGTLLNTLTALSYCTNLALGKYGLGRVPTEEFKWIVGDGYVNQIKRSLTYLGDKELVHLEEACKDYMEIFHKHCMYEVRPYEGILKMLEELKRQGIKLAVFSNKPHDQTVVSIEEAFGKGFFDEIAGQIDGVPKKPDPSGAIRIARKLGVKKEECLYIGDTNTDMKTGIAAGMDTLGVLWGFRSREELEAFHPMAVIEHPKEILNYIEK